jgi:DNA-binding MarR family transcriptional regulator
MRDRASTGRHPRSRWATQALVVAAGVQGSLLADLVATRCLAPSTVRCHLRRLEQIGRVVRRDGRWFAATETVTF